LNAEPEKLGDFVLYPGCCAAADGPGKQMMSAAIAVCGAIGLGLTEIPGWHCCGGSGWLSRWAVGSAALAIDNLSRAGTQDVDAVCLCPSCATVLQKGIRLVQQLPGLGDRMAVALSGKGLRMPGKTRARHILEVLGDPVYEPIIRGRVRRPLRGARVCCYYGCKSQGVEGAMERLMECAGAEVVALAETRACCGRSEPAETMEAARALANDARQKGAQFVSTACPWCTIALQAVDGAMQAFFFAQVLAGAFALPAAQAGLRVGRERRTAVLRARASRGARQQDER